MMTVTEQIKNLEVLIAHIETRKELYLRAYKLKNECGTLYCVAGEIPTIPHFQELGVYAKYLGAPTTKEFEENENDVDPVLNNLFGQFKGEYEKSAYFFLCATKGYGIWDKELDPDYIMTDKELALARLNKALEIRKTELVAQ